MYKQLVPRLTGIDISCKAGARHTPTTNRLCYSLLILSSRTSRLILRKLFLNPTIRNLSYEHITIEVLIVNKSFETYKDEVNK